MNKKEEIDKNGWILIKNIFTPEEIDNLRNDVLKEKNHQGDLLSSQLLSKIITDERLLNIYKECLGSDTIYYFGDSSFSINRPGKGGFHKDSKDRDKKNSMEFKDVNYSLLRMGIYLQDHSISSKGLCLRDKSHLQQSTGKGKMINVKSEIGDILIWKLTTTHSANAGVISLFPNYSFHPRVARLFPDFLKQKAVDPRIAIFTCFGLKDEYANSYREYLKTREYAVERWAASNYSEDVLSKLKNLNVDVYTDFNLKEIDTTKISAGYKQI
jgi:hypothetical protein